MNGVGTIALMLLLGTSMAFYLYYGHGFGLLEMYSLIEEKGFVKGIWEWLLQSINAYVVIGAAISAFVGVGQGISYSLRYALITTAASILLVPFTVLNEITLPPYIDVIVKTYFMVLLVLAVVSFFSDREF